MEAFDTGNRALSSNPVLLPNYLSFQFSVRAVLERKLFSNTPATTEREINNQNDKYPDNKRLSRWVITEDISTEKPDADYTYNWYKSRPIP
jgi:hypothetical protein